MRQYNGLSATRNSTDKPGFPAKFQTAKTLLLVRDDRTKLFSICKLRADG